jgi:hypothetical protein
VARLPPQVVPTSVLPFSESVRSLLPRNHRSPPAPRVSCLSLLDCNRLIDVGEGSPELPFSRRLLEVALYAASADPSVGDVAWTVEDNSGGGVQGRSGARR